MGVADEILKLKNLLDAGAITQEEFEQMKKKALEKETSNARTSNNARQSAPSSSGSGLANVNYSNSTNYLYPNSQVSNPTPARRLRYFNSTPFYVIGYISMAIAVIFSLIVIVSLATKNSLTAVSLAWEFIFVPAAITLVFGIIIRVKAFNAGLMVAGIILLIVGFILSIVATVVYAQSITSSYRSVYGSYYLWIR